MVEVDVEGFSRCLNNANHSMIQKEVNILNLDSPKFLPCQNLRELVGGVKIAFV